jgi:hypothetical protein
MWTIRKANTNFYLATDIDSSGMSVHWTSHNNADTFNDKDQAESMLKRLLEHYPKEEAFLEYTS